MHIFDTSAIIEFIDGSEKGSMVKNLLEKESAAISSITINELLICAYTTERETLEQLINSFHVFSFNSVVAYKSVEIEQNLRKKGKPMGKLDIFIAAVAQLYDIPLVTCDKGFKNIDDLKIVFI